VQAPPTQAPQVQLAWQVSVPVPPQARVSPGLQVRLVTQLPPQQ
jgi:hypothetical protein